MPIELGISTGSNELTPAQFRRLREEFEASQRTDSAATGSASRGGRATSPQSAVSDDEFHEAGGVGLVAESAERLLADSLESDADADFHEADSGMPEVAAAAAAAPAISAVAPQRSGWGSWLWGVRSSSRSSLTSQDTDSAFSSPLPEPELELQLQPQPQPQPEPEPEPEPELQGSQPLDRQLFNRGAAPHYPHSRAAMMMRASPPHHRGTEPPAISPRSPDGLQQRVLALLRSTEFRRAEPGDRGQQQQQPRAHTARLAQRVRALNSLAAEAVRPDLVRHLSTGHPHWPVRARAVHWRQLEQLGRLPRLPEDAEMICDLEDLLERFGDTHPNKRFRLLMVSHRWEGKVLVDDKKNTKAKMLSATGRQQAEEMGEEMYFWIDYAAIDQSDKELRRVGMQLLPLYAACCESIVMIEGQKGDYDRRAWTRVERMLAWALCSEPSFFWLRRLDDNTGQMPRGFATLSDPSEGKVSVPADRDVIELLVEAAQAAVEVDGLRSIELGVTRVHIKDLADDVAPRVRSDVDLPRPVRPSGVSDLRLDTGQRRESMAQDPRNDHAAERRTFDALDENGDGRVSRVALLQAVKQDDEVRSQLGLLPEHQAVGHLDAVFQSMDYPGETGQISFDEFRAYLDVCRQRIPRQPAAPTTPAREAAPSASKSWSVWPWSASPAAAAAAAEPGAEGKSVALSPAGLDRSQNGASPRGVSPLHSEVLRQNELIQTTIEHLQSLIDPDRESPAYIRTLQALESRAASPLRYSRQAPDSVDRTTSMGRPGVSGMQQSQASQGTSSPGSMISRGTSVPRMTSDAETGIIGTDMGEDQAPIEQAAEADSSTWGIGGWLTSPFSSTGSPAPSFRIEEDDVPATGRAPRSRRTNPPKVQPETAPEVVPDATPEPDADADAAARYLVIGAELEVYSRSSKGWVAATVQEVTDVAVRVQYLGPRGSPMEKSLGIDTEGQTWRYIAESAAKPAPDLAPEPEPEPEPKAEPEPRPTFEPAQESETKHERGVDVQPTTNAAELVAGAALEIFSRSSGGWVAATVQAVDDYRIKVTYLSPRGQPMEKTVAQDTVGQSWRPIARESESSPGPRSEREVLLERELSAPQTAPPAQKLTQKSLTGRVAGKRGKYSELPVDERNGTTAHAQPAATDVSEVPDIMTQLFIVLTHIQTFVLLVLGPALVDWPSAWLDGVSWLRFVSFGMESLAPPLVAFALSLTLPLLVVARAILRLWLCDDSQYSDMDRREWKQIQIEEWPTQRNGLIFCWIVAPCVLTATVLVAEDTRWSHIFTLGHSEDLLPIFGVFCCVVGYVLGACFGTGYSAPIIARVFSRTAMIAMAITVVLALGFHLFYIMYFHATPTQLQELGNTSHFNGTTSLHKSDGDRGVVLSEYLGASVVISLVTVFGVRICFRTSNFVAMAVQWTHESHETIMTCCGLVPYDERMRSAMLPSFLLGAWIFVSGIWDVPDDNIEELQHPFAAGACTIAAGCVLYGLISLGTGRRLLRLWREKRLRNIDEDSFFKRWAFREFSALLLVFFVTHVSGMTLALHHFSAGYAAAPVLYILACIAGPFYVVTPTVVVAIAAANLRRRILLQHALASVGPARLETAMRTLTGRWRVVGRDAHGQHVMETVILKCRSQKVDGGGRKIAVEGEHDEREGHEPFKLTNGELSEERGVLRVRFTQQYYTEVKEVDPETGETALLVTQQNEDSTTAWEATLTHCHCHGSDSVPRLHGWWSGDYKQSPFHHRFHATKSLAAPSATSGSTAARGAQKSAVDGPAGHVITGLLLTDDEYATALSRGVADTHESEPHIASAMPLINQFRQGAWMAMPLQMAEQVAIASVVHGCTQELRLRVCISLLGAAFLLTLFKQPYVSSAGNWSSIVARASNLTCVLLGVLIERGTLTSEVGTYLLFGNAGLICLVLLGSFSPLRMVSASMERCRQIRRGMAETKTLLVDDIAIAMSDASTLDFWQRQRSVEGQPMARFQQTVRSCFPQGASYGLHNLEMLDLRSLGVLEQHTKQELAALLAEARCERLLVLRVLLVEERASGVALDVTTEGHQMPLQNQSLGPDDMHLVAGWMCSRVPAEKLASVDLSHNFIFGRKSFHGGEDFSFSAIGSPSVRSVPSVGRNSLSGDLPTVVHTVDDNQAGWLQLTAALQDSCIGSLVLCGVGLGPVGLRSLARALLDGLRCLETLDLSENHLRIRNGNGSDALSLKAFSALCHALVGTSVKRLSLARCGIDAAALGFLPEVPADPSGAKSASGKAARYPLSNSPILSLRSLNLSGNPLTNSEPFLSAALENYEPRDLRYPSSPRGAAHGSVVIDVRLDREVRGLQRLCHAVSKAQQLTRLDLSACGLGAEALDALRTEMVWPNTLRVLCLNDNPGLLGKVDAHGKVSLPDVNRTGWSRFCEALSHSRLGELQLRQIGLGPRGLSTLAGKLECKSVDPTPFSSSLTALDLSENFLFGSEPLNAKVVSHAPSARSGPCRQTPDKDQSGWKDLCSSIPLAMVNTLLVQRVGCGTQGADILASAIAKASKRAAATGQPLRLQCVDLKRNEALPIGHLDQWNDPQKNLVVRH